MKPVEPLARLYSRLDKIAYGSGLRSPKGLTLPNFLGIGAQKAGTTWLYENLRRHPEVAFPGEKEIHYFDWQYYKPIRWYASVFEGAPGKIRGDITPGYSILPRSRIRLIRRLMPEVKLILLIRNPIDRAWSHAVMKLATIPGRRIDDVTATEFHGHFTSAASRRRGDYLAIIDNWLSVFPEEALFIGSYDHIETQSRELLENIFDHIGVSSTVDYSNFPCEQIIVPHLGSGPPQSGRQIEGYVPTHSRQIPETHRAVLEKVYCDEIEALYARLRELVSGWRCR